MKRVQFLNAVAAITLSGALLAGCAVPVSTPAAAEPAAPAAEAPAEAAPTAEEAPAAETTAASGEVVEINLLLFNNGGVGEGAKAVQDAMNEITEKSIGVKANISWSDGGTYGTQVSMAIAGGDDLDVIAVTPIPPVNFSGLVTNNQVLDITDYLEEYAPDALATLGDYASGMSVNGRIYGIPNFRNYANANYIVMRADILEELGLTEKAKALNSWSGYEEILEEVKEKTELSPVVGLSKLVAPGCMNGDSFDDCIAYDTLGDTLNLIYSDEEGNISLLPENEYYRNGRDMTREWNEKGYIYKDAAVTDDHCDVLMKAGTVFSSTQNSNLGVETQKKEATGYEVICVPYVVNPVRSATVANFGLALPITCQEPEAALRWINELYADPALQNLLTWGIEGKDYVLNEGEAEYPEGVSAENAGYHAADFLYGNFFTTYPWSGSGADFRQVAREYLDNAPVSPYLGFAADLSELQNTITALNSVYQKYMGMIGCGQYTDEEYEQYISELKTAGSDEYIGSYQQQVSDWMAASN